jgi:hypothetical protein
MWYDQDLNDLLPNSLNLGQSSFRDEYSCITSDIMSQFTFVVCQCILCIPLIWLMKFSYCVFLVVCWCTKVKTCIYYFEFVVILKYIIWNSNYVSLCTYHGLFFPVGEEHKTNSWNGALNIRFTKVLPLKIKLKELASDFMQIS